MSTKVLVGCEFSGIVRDSFIEEGIEAYSCDLLDNESDNHICMDLFEAIHLADWDLIIAHPPCTALCVSGNSTYAKDKPKHDERINSLEWTERLWIEATNSCNRVCFENPVGVLATQSILPKPQYIQPYQFGHMEQKKTGLFLHNLPELKETNNVYDEMMKLPKNQRERLHYLPPSKDRWMERSKTFKGIAKAMATQWGNLL